MKKLPSGSFSYLNSENRQKNMKSIEVVTLSNIKSNIVL